MKLKPRMLGLLGALGFLGIFLDTKFGFLGLLSLLGFLPDPKPKVREKPQP